MADLEPIGYQLVIITVVFGFIALATLSVRVWFRLRQGKHDASDTCLIAAMTCAIIQSAIQLILVIEFDYGTAKADIPAHLRTSEWPSKLSFVNQVVFKLTTPLSKLSLCLLYRAMCSTSTDPVIRVTRVAIWGTILLIVGAYGSAFLISNFQCTPISKTWNKKVDGTCIDLTEFRMRKHRPEVKQLLALILLGLVHTGLTIARFVIMFYPDPLTKTEPQYAHIAPNCLAVVEMDVGIWVATLVVMRPALHALRRIRHPNYKSERSTAFSYSHSGTGNGYHMKNYTAKSKKREDEFRILETTEIHVTSEELGQGVGRVKFSAPLSIENLIFFSVEGTQTLIQDGMMHTFSTLEDSDAGSDHPGISCGYQVDRRDSKKTSTPIYYHAL
ncbi:hypothetical protein P153DRAFT_434616 [Dothidotthia symphoricarpi CBS 119687]|uniref:Rhodopsin domain-containing protein n=1 Tax=Dothidotthia symphoricarpi CBS 119687 TaxID=1392245 RepID=A0A6A6A3V6_9PLEO|nr:uncharacterized protein P153DRAFT_434616 [Dothidotthia symphoricarpi CBS 119687]KAF2125597.1 hypothetical protein P153DRAFT_434616 [Dothidotthia symphoricarpi CBS 119687]